MGKRRRLLLLLQRQHRGHHCLPMLKEHFVLVVD
jgi:hypothetical protein